MPEIDFSKLLQQAVEWSPMLVSAILILIIGFWIANNLTNVLKKLMAKAKIDETLRPFLSSLVSVILKVMVVIAAAGQVGIETTSFLAILGAAGLAIGLALQGSLQNFAAGTMILVFKPYKIGELVELQGYVGHVQEIQIFNTVLTTLDSKKVIIPNAAATSGPIVNISALGTIRVDLVFGVAYDADLDTVKNVIKEVAGANELITKLDCDVIGHGASSVDFAVRPWCNPADYWTVHFYMHEQLKKAFDKNNIGIPYTTYDVNILK